MSLFVLSDTHLSTSDSKPMDVFGRRWQGYTEKLRRNWNAVVSSEDTVVVPGDISWAMFHDGALGDLAFINALNGKKLIGKGNHDYWWTSMKKLGALLEANNINTIDFLYNNAYFAEDFIITGTRGWYIDVSSANAPDGADYDKIVAREAARFELSLKAAEKLRAEHPDAEMLAFFHFPPVYNGYVCRPIIELLHKYGIRRTYYGHIHGVYDIPRSISFEDIRFTIASADYLNFTPLMIALSDS